MQPPTGLYLFEQLFGISFLSVRWYGVLIVSGAFVAGMLATHRARARSQDPEHVWNLLLFGMILGMLYSLGRFFTEGLRTDSLCVGQYTLDGSCVGGLRIAQLVSLIALVVCGSILAWRHRPRVALPTLLEP